MQRKGLIKKRKQLPIIDNERRSDKLHQQTLLRLLGAPEHQEHGSAGTASGHPGMTKSATFWSGVARKVMDLPDCI